MMDKTDVMTKSLKEISIEFNGIEYREYYT